ncbi:MAG: hypothetical protein SOW59_04235 [Corynebacterium sp.]|nr:hypothetical protein [Corynebacterium sp.]
MSSKRNKLKVRWWHILLIALSVIAFFGLALWQWTRFQSGSGSFQNLGYALQWPLFAAFVIYAYRTALHYENDRIAAENTAADNGSADFQYSAEKNSSPELEELEKNFLPQRRRLSVEEFNELNAPRRGGISNKDRGLS